MKRDRIRIQYSVAIAFCKRDLGVDWPSPPQLAKWATTKAKDLFPDGMTIGQAKQILANPLRCFGDE